MAKSKARNMVTRIYSCNCNLAITHIYYIALSELLFAYLQVSLSRYDVPKGNDVVVM